MLEKMLLNASNSHPHGYCSFEVLAIVVVPPTQISWIIDGHYMAKKDIVIKPTLPFYHYTTSRPTDITSFEFFSFVWSKQK